MSRTVAEIGTNRYAVTIDANGHAIVADEATAHGGGGLGPAPYDLLLASLAACTAITLRMYADRKQWDLQSLKVVLDYARHGGAEHVDRALEVTGFLDEAQRARLVEIADKTPVTLTLKRGLAITTTIIATPVETGRNAAASPA